MALKLILVLLLVLASPLFAVQVSKWQRRFALVGVISEDDPGTKAKGVVVLRDLDTKKTLTLKGGEKVPGIDGFKVFSIRRKQVIIRRGEEQIELSYADLDRSETESTVVKSSGDVKPEDRTLPTIWPISSQAEDKTIIETLPTRIFLPSDGIFSQEDVDAFNQWSENHFSDDASDRD